MAQRSLKYTLVLLMLLISVAITYWAHTRPAIAIASAKLASLPAQIGKWHQIGADEETSQEVLQGWMVTRDSFLGRTYQNENGEQVDLLLVYKGLDRRGWHLSEACFSGSGYDVTQTVTKIPYAGREQCAVQLTAKNSDPTQSVVSIYWFALGPVAEHNFWKQQASMALARLFPPKEGWAFIRVTSDLNGSEKETMGRIRDFIASASGPLLECLASEPENANAQTPDFR